MGVYKFYLGPHKSGKKEKYPYSNPLEQFILSYLLFVC